MNIALMKKLCTMTQAQLLSVLPRYLRQNGYKPKVTKEYIIAEGTLPICLVAHLDTIHELEHNGVAPTTVLYDAKEQLMMAVGGKCADDRAGVYAIIQLVYQEDRKIPLYLRTLHRILHLQVEYKTF